MVIYCNSGLLSRQTTELTHYVVLFSLKTKRYGTIIPSPHLYIQGFSQLVGNNTNNKVQNDTVVVLGACLKTMVLLQYIGIG